MKEKRRRSPPAPGFGTLVHHGGYATDHARFHLWMDRIVERGPGPWYVSSALLGLSLYLCGLAIAVPFGFEGIYLDSIAVVLGAVGFSLVLATTSLAHRRAHESYAHLRPIFDVSDDYYREILGHWFKRLRDPKATRVWVGGVLCIGGITMLATYASTAHFRSHYHLTALRPPSYAAGWFSADHRWPALLIQGVYAVAVAVALGTAARMLVINLLFSWRLRELPILPVPSLVRARLRQVTDLYVMVSLAWTAGVALFGLLFRGAYDAVAVTFIGVLFVLGLAQLAVPQVICRRYIYNSYDRLCRLVLASVYHLAGGVLVERRDAPPDLLADREAFLPGNLADLAQLSAQPKVWVYDARDVALWVGTQVTAAGLLLLTRMR